jgi:hypothetical protein
MALNQDPFLAAQHLGVWAFIQSTLITVTATSPLIAQCRSPELLISKPATGHDTASVIANVT